MHIERIRTNELGADERKEILALCAEAYEEDLSPYLEWIGEGVHLYVRDAGEIASHLMIVERALQAGSAPALRTGYVELVATRPDRQGRGLASRLMRAVIEDLTDFDLGALSPSDSAFYERLGWEMWRGPRFVREGDTLRATPEEDVMVYRTPRTPAWLDLDLALSCEWREGEVW